MRLKEAVLRVARSLGAFALARDSAWRSKRLLIVCWHGVTTGDEHEWNPSMYITQERLRERLRGLRDGGYNVLPLANAVERLYDGTLPPRSIALTFDDGATDFERLAVPVLREFNMPATVYLTTYYCNARFPVFDVILTYVIWKGRNSGADLAPLCESPVPLPVAGDADRKRTRKALHDFATARKLSAAEKNAFVTRVAASLGVDYDDIMARDVMAIMTPDAVRGLPADLVDVQLHTHRHRTPRDAALFAREIEDNAAEIRTLRGEDATLDHFCYPSGVYYGEFLPWLREQGVRYATTCLPDLATRDTEPLLIPRFVDAMTQPAVVFEAWASGFAALMPRRRIYRLDATRLAVAPQHSTAGASA